MNFRKLSLLFLVLVFALSTITVNAVSADYHDNIYCCETVAQQAWYTKLIKLDNFNRKDVSGTLHFKLVPYEGKNKEYVRNVKPENAGQTDPEEGGGEFSSEVRNGPPGTGDGDPTQSVKIVPGVTEFSYKVPFSSEDYVDTTFNNLALNAKEPAGNSLDLFNHAILHEWGRIESADHYITIRVGKLYEKQFKNLKLTQDEIKEIYEKQKAKADEYKLSWPGDPDTEGVVGWMSDFGDQYYNSEDHLYDFLGDSKFKPDFKPDSNPDSNFLNEHENFKNGKFNLEDYVSPPKLGMRNGTNFYLRMTTRPIAISKEYDGKGNIKSIEKPLIPSKDAYNFIEKHNNALKGRHEDVDGYVMDKVFRYRLIEESPDGIDLKPSDKQMIVDVSACGGLLNDIHVFEDEASADKFYTNFFENLDEGLSMDASILHDAFIFSEEYKAQLVNKINEYTIVVDPNGGNWNGSTAKMVENAVKGDSFILPEAPKKDGYKFLYWKGSEYQPGQEYIVQGSHTFTAEWAKDEEKPEPQKPEPQKPEPQKPEPKKPTKEKPASVDKTPRTGDNLDVALYAGVLVMMSAGVLLILRKKSYK